MVQKTALITGITGQDGAYLAEFLLARGYAVHGIKRRASSFNTERIDHLYSDPHDPAAQLFLHYGDMTDATSLIRIVQETQPDEIYNLAAQSHVPLTPMGSALCAFSKPSVCWVSPRSPGFTRHRHPSFMELYARHPSLRPRHFIRVPPTRQRSFMPIG
jgi:hypothetical protein